MTTRVKCRTCQMRWLMSCIHYKLATSFPCMQTALRIDFTWRGCSNYAPIIWRSSLGWCHWSSLDRGPKAVEEYVDACCSGIQAARSRDVKVLYTSCQGACSLREQNFLESWMGGEDILVKLRSRLVGAGINVGWLQVTSNIYLYVPEDGGSL